MKERFEGDTGRRLRVEALATQKVVGGNDALAQELAAHVTVDEHPAEFELITQDSDTNDIRGGRVCLNTVSLSMSGSSAGLVDRIPVSGPCARRA